MTELPVRSELPVGSIGRHANGWWGMWTIIATEGALFAYLLFSYFYIAVQNGRSWLPDVLPPFSISLPSTLLLLSSSVFIWDGNRRLKLGAPPLEVALHLLATAVAGILFVAMQYKEWTTKSFTLSSGSYGSLYFTIEGLHIAHLIVGIVIVVVLAIWTFLGYFDMRRSAAVSIGALYWHFVNAILVAVFFTFYITPYLGLG